ncbi:hypothetical protein ACFQQB_29970 [Nonomuraea rubra]|uniref:hypothetical protein n=1 Tax=Nonomuraea rubra TaxID=46180 RepID=UPI003614C0DD
MPTAPEQSPNTRTPGFDLDSVYGGGPAATPSTTTPPTPPSSGWRAAAGSRTCRAGRTVRRSSPTPATTRT